MAYILGVDIGTSGTKTVLFSEDGTPVASATYEYPLYTPQNGYAEQEPLDWWNASVNGIKDVISQSNVSADDIKGVGLSGQMHGLVMLDAENQPIRKSIIWCDQRTEKECEEITEKVGAKRLIEITANPALTGFTASKILWVRNHEPENYAKCKHILLPKDYVRYILTGEFATEVSDASGMQLLDVPKRQWSDEVLEKLDIDKNLLAKVYESPEVTGKILPEIAAKTGLSTETVVVGGAGDNAAAAVGTGVVEDGKAFTTIGTSGVVFAHSNNISIDPKGRVHTFCCAVPGAWHVMGVTQAAGYSLAWFQENIGTEYARKAKEQGCGAFDLINADVQKTPIGARLMIIIVISIIMSLNWLKKFATVSARSPNFARITPMINANTMICSISPLARELIGLSGIIFNNVSVNEVAFMDSTDAALVLIVLMSSPTPGLIRFPTDNATVTASAVVAR